MLLYWVIFNIFVLIMLIIDLKVFNKKAHEIKIKEAIIWTFIWIALALIFNVIIYFWMGEEAALEYLTGYLLEKSLSMDNLFVFLLIFSYFNVSPKYEHKVLLWGIIGALIMRALFIILGITLIQSFHWVMYVFGILLIVTGIKTWMQKDKKIKPEKNLVLRLFRRFVPITQSYVEGKFFIFKNKKLWATPLLVVLLVIETTDVIFAMDSLPAIFAITLNPFIVYTSNIFAILGLRALYFALAGFMKLFEYLYIGLSVILIFIGLKMLLVDIYTIPIIVALGVVAGTLIISVIASLLHKNTQ